MNIVTIFVSASSLPFTSEPAAAANVAAVRFALLSFLFFLFLWSFWPPSGPQLLRTLDNLIWRELVNSLPTQRRSSLHVLSRDWGGPLVPFRGCRTFQLLSRSPRCCRNLGSFPQGPRSFLLVLTPIYHRENSSASVMVSCIMMWVKHNGKKPNSRLYKSLHTNTKGKTSLASILIFCILMSKA